MKNLWILWHTPLSSPFFVKNQQLLLYQEIQIYIVLNLRFLIVSNLFWAFKDCFNRQNCIFDDVNNIGCCRSIWIRDLMTSYSLSVTSLATIYQSTQILFLPPACPSWIGLTMHWHDVTCINPDVLLTN